MGWGGLETEREGGSATDLGGPGGHEVAGDEAGSVGSQEATFGHASEQGSRTQHENTHRPPELASRPPSSSTGRPPAHVIPRLPSMPPPAARISYGGHVGTVRFCGPVPPAPGLWLGIEWDDPARGRHDGCKDGARYFASL